MKPPTGRLEMQRQRYPDPMGGLKEASMSDPLAFDAVAFAAVTLVLVAVLNLVG